MKSPTSFFTSSKAEASTCYTQRIRMRMRMGDIGTYKVRVLWLDSRYGLLVVTRRLAV